MSSSRLKPSVTAWKCSFCRGALQSSLSGEHIWPKWSAKYFPRTPHDKRIEARMSSELKSRIQTLTAREERHGHTTTKKLRVVCRKCNETWMKDIEDGAKPSLEPMIRGHRAVLCLDQQTALATWVTLKMMVVDLSISGDSVFSEMDRNDFRTTRVIKPYMKIWLFPYCGEWWRSAMRQEAALFSPSPTAFPSPSDRPLRPKNTKLFVIGFGNLLAAAIFSQITELGDYATIDFSGPVAHLWPSRTGAILWPPGLPIDDKAAQYVAQTLERFSQSPGVIAMP
jgi:hypothetical protein